MRRRPKPTKPSTPRPAGARKRPSTDRARLREVETRLAEAREQQVASSEILRAISRLSTDLQPTLDAIATTAARVCGANDAQIYLLDGDTVRRVAKFGPLPTTATADAYPLRRESVTGRAMLTRQTVHIADVVPVLATEFPHSPANFSGARTVLATPLIREGAAIGAILIRRMEVRPFSEDQVEMLRTFADQAVIAIENVRLVTALHAKNQALVQAHAEVSEALERQTATSEILAVISRSPTDVTPVLRAVVGRAARLCATEDVALLLVDGDELRMTAGVGPLYQSAPPDLRIPLTRSSVATRAVVDRATVHVRDLAAEPDEDFSIGRQLALRFGHRTMLGVPMLREGAPIGVICAFRCEVRPFSEQQIALLETFAAQSVIAIENVRLFNELREKNGALTEALEQQTATAEILRVISSSPTDLQPVFDTIVRNAVRLCAATFGGLQRITGNRMTLDAQYGVPPDELRVLQRDVFPLPISRESATGRAVLDCSIAHIPDIREDPEFRTPRLQTMQRYRTILAVPMMREGIPIGALALWRAEVRRFTSAEIALVQTFADQAVIAIENVRLLRELQARTEQLTHSVEQLTALAEVGRAISSTLDLQTVLARIAARATQLAGVDAGAIYEYDEGREIFEPRATHQLEAEIVRALEASPVRKGEGVTGRLAEVRAPIQVADFEATPAQGGASARDALLRAGYRGLLAVPLLREEQLIGGLTVFRKAPGEYAPDIVEVLRTFASQSALAIQNARLFRELEQKSRELEAASRHKSEFLANMSHELRTPLNAVIGFSEVLSERMFGELNEKQDEYMRDIYASGQHLLSLINDILDLSKIEAGRMELELADFDLPSAIDNALILVRERAGRRSIALAQSIGEGVGTIRADERKVKQVLLNLLSNALKFTPEGGRVDVAAMVRDEMVEVSVADTGVGIALEDQEAVFEEFRQVGMASKKIEGTGLGLALCRKFVELHGGRIWVDSRLGAGATFTFSLPLARPG